jgi:hypothetical protein
MPIAQVNDRIKEAPVAMLRAVFSGIGQLLLAAEKVRARAAEQVWPPVRTAADRLASGHQSWHSATDTPNGTERGGQAMAEDHLAEREEPGSPGARTAQVRPADPDFAAPATVTPPATVTAPATGTGSGAALAEPPLPGYDDLSFPSLRARLRTMDAPALRAMIDYEKAHARREPVVSMLERRLSKITAG